MDVILQEAGGLDLFVKIFSFSNAKKEKNTRTEAILNKHVCIYPTLMPLENHKNFKGTF